jgi:DNA mismatch repair protein MutS
VILDEIGRGTATFDGLSLAWAVAEHLASNPRARPKTLFATHYHELTDLADALPAWSTSTSSCASGRTTSSSCARSCRGRSDRSYGIQVARLAGLPIPVELWSRARARSWRRSSATSCRAAAGRR